MFFLVKKKFFVLFFVLFVLFSSNFNCYAFDTPLSYNQLKSFIDVYNNFFNVSIAYPEESEVLNFDYVGCGIFKNLFDEYSLILIRDSDASSYSLSTISSSRIELEDDYNNFSFIVHDFDGLKWDYSTSYVKSDDNISDFVMFSDNVNISKSNILYYRYNFTSGTILKQIDDINQEIIIINNNISNLQSEVDKNSNAIAGLEETTGDVSQKLDTVIKNQTIISDKIDDNGNRVIESINENGELTRTTITETGDKIIEFIKEDSNSTSGDFVKNFPSNEVEDQTAETFNNIFTQINSALTTSDPNISIDIPFPNGSTTTITASELSTKNSGLQTFTSTILMFSMSLVVIKDFRREIEKIKNGKIDDVANEDITANSL